jgi:acyl-CoA dehydrogenase
MSAIPTDFLLTPELAALRRRVRALVDAEIVPNEERVIAEDAVGGDAELRRLQQRARDEGLWTPHLPREHGGLGLGPMGMSALFREMGRSVVGARSFNCDAPDQGNMDLLIRAASPAVRERWLGPLVRAEITSAFCMTEPAPGAGADPSNLRTTARPDGDGFVIDGHKWYTTGGGRAAFLIVLARTADDAATMLVVDRHADGVEHVRDIDVMGPPLLAHREAEMRFHGVRVGHEAVLGRVGDGFRLAQARLVPARLTHCMRWLGLAARTLEMCRAYLTTRRSFGKTLAEHQLVQLKIAEGAAAIHAGNMMTLHCATLLEQGLDREARPYSSMAKNHVATALCRILDDAIQLHGGLGYSADVPFERWYRWSRAARIADGPDEVHTMSVARAFFKERFELLV